MSMITDVKKPHSQFAKLDGKGAEMKHFCNAFLPVLKTLLDSSVPEHKDMIEALQAMVGLVELFDSIGYFPTSKQYSKARNLEKRFFQYYNSLSQWAEKTGNFPAAPEKSGCIASALRVHCECNASALRVHCECIASAMRVHCECIASALRDELSKMQASPKAKANVPAGVKRVGKVEPKEAPFVPDPEGRTTVMLRNLPNNYTRDMLLELIDSLGFRGQYDFLYLPIDFQTQACLGYAFVNLVDSGVVPAFWRAFDGFSNWSLPSRKVCYISWSGPHQGLEAHIDRYRNSPVMHPDVGDECKPLIFKDGVRVMFPPPTKSIRPPRVRKRTDSNQGSRPVKNQVDKVGFRSV
eukprot:s2780_g10.t3